MRLVQLDPMLVLVDCPIADAACIETGQLMQVTPVDSRIGPRTGKVVLVSKVADGGSQTLKLKLSVPNPNGEWLAGLKVLVEAVPFAPLPATPRVEAESTAGP